MTSLFGLLQQGHYIFPPLPPLDVETVGEISNPDFRRPTDPSSCKSALDDTLSEILRLPSPTETQNQSIVRGSGESCDVMEEGVDMHPMDGSVMWMSVLSDSFDISNSYQIFCEFFVPISTARLQSKIEPFELLLRR